MCEGWEQENEPLLLLVVVVGEEEGHQRRMRDGRAHRDQILSHDADRSVGEVEDEGDEYHGGGQWVAGRP